LIFVFGLLLLVVPLLVIGILYPDDPANRRIRMVRILVTTFAFSVALGVGSFVAAAAGNIAWSPLTIVGTAWISAAPLSVAERVAGLWRPHRARFWAFAGVAACLVWAGILYLLSEEAGTSLLQAVAIVEFTIAGIVGGLTWYAFLPKRDPDVGQVFE
jgi:hypothetical protein